MEENIVKVTCSGDSRKVISPLVKWIMDQPLEELLGFLHGIGVQYTMSGNSRSPHKRSLFYGRIFIQEGQFVSGEDTRNVRLYEGKSNSSAKSAMCNALAKFLVEEKHDYHTYKGLPQPKEEIEEVGHGSDGEEASGNEGKILI